MTDLISLLTTQPNHNEMPNYSIIDIKSHATLSIDLANGGLLAVLEDPDGTHVSFVVFSFNSGPSTIDGGVVVGPILYDKVFDGRGPSSGLRELRHTYWGEPNNSGYIHYPDGELISHAFRELRRWFDC